VTFEVPAKLAFEQVHLARRFGASNLVKKTRFWADRDLRSIGVRGIWYSAAMDRPVLIVIDMLNDFFKNVEVARRKELVGAINDLVSLFRSSGAPVVWVRQEFEPDLQDAFPEMRAKGIHITIRGTAGCHIISELIPALSDPVIIKKRYSAFFGTNLDEVLDHLQPESIILAGINTHACIRMTAIDAYQRDWPVILASDCIASYDREHHDVTLKYMKDKIAAVLTNQEIGIALSLSR
jgi:nicotinamidase-related amidase